MAEQTSQLPPSEDNCCAICYNVHDKMQRCGSCHAAIYCSRACQVADWPLHKLLCKEFAETKNPEAAADGSIPGGGLGQYRRSIFFHPDEDKPKVVWVKITSLDFKLMQEGKGKKLPFPGRSPNKFMPMTMVVASPWEYHATSTASAEEKVLAKARGTLVQKNLDRADPQTVMKTGGLIIGFRAGYMVAASTANNALSNTVRASGVHPESVWKGPFVFRRPKEAGNINLNDFRHLVRHLHLSPALAVAADFVDDTETMKNIFTCTLRLCPLNPRCQIKNDDDDLDIRHGDWGGTTMVLTGQSMHRNVGMENIDIALAEDRA